MAEGLSVRRDSQNPSRWIAEWKLESSVEPSRVDRTEKLFTKYQGLDCKRHKMQGIINNVYCINVKYFTLNLKKKKKESYLFIIVCCVGAINPLIKKSSFTLLTN